MEAEGSKELSRLFDLSAAERDPTRKLDLFKEALCQLEEASASLDFAINQGQVAQNLRRSRIREFLLTLPALRAFDDVSTARYWLFFSLDLHDELPIVVAADPRAKSELDKFLHLHQARMGKW